MAHSVPSSKPRIWIALAHEIDVFQQDITWWKLSFVKLNRCTSLVLSSYLHISNLVSSNHGKPIQSLDISTTLRLVVLDAGNIRYYLLLLPWDVSSIPPIVQTRG